MKKNDVVKFHTPMPDENPNSRYLLLSDPEAERAHAERVNKLYPQCPTHPKVDIEYLGEVVDGKLVPTTLAFRPISTVKPDDLEADESLAYVDHGPKGFEIRAK